MTTVSVSYARQNFPQLVNRAYAGEEFLVVKNNIPVVTIQKSVQINSDRSKKRALSSVFGLWKDRPDMKGKTTIEIADELRKKAWYGSYDH